MSSVRRLGGAMLLTSGDRYFVVGAPKRPIDWNVEGFGRPRHTQEPGTSELIPWFELFPLVDGDSPPALATEPKLVLALEAEAACAVLHDRLTIRRNGSVSERLWDLVVESSPSEGGERDARWLVGVPGPIWEIVRDTILKCV